jgi:GT2 family glycosyltransferase
MVLIKNGENLGYARGNNVGIRFALSRKADYVFVLNNDTTLSPSAISQLVTFGRLYPDAALMSPRIFQPLAGGIIDSGPSGLLKSPLLSLNFMPSWLNLRADPASNDLSETSPLRLYYAPGCAMMFRSGTFTTVGLFDEKTFLYYEEFIMGEKLKRAGLVTYYVPDAEVYHLQGATTAKITPAHKYIYAVKSQKYYFSHYQQIGWLPMAALSLKVTLAFLFRAIINDGYRRNLMRFLRSYY